MIGTEASNILLQCYCAVTLSAAVVGVAGLEPATSCPLDMRASQLRHTPAWSL